MLPTNYVILAESNQCDVDLRMPTTSVSPIKNYILHFVYSVCDCFIHDLNLILPKRTDQVLFSDIYMLGGDALDGEL